MMIDSDFDIRIRFVYSIMMIDSDFDSRLRFVYSVMMIDSYFDSIRVWFWQRYFLILTADDSEEETTQSRVSHSQQDDSWADDSVSLGPEGKKKVTSPQGNQFSPYVYIAFMWTRLYFEMACLICLNCDGGVFFLL